MILKEIKISELNAFIQSVEYSSWKHVPISPARAYSQSLNPNALPDDIVLIIALDDETAGLLAYAGALPSKTEKNETIRFAWNSCWWVAEGVGGEVAMNVFIRFLQAWGKKVAFSDMTEKTFKIIRSLGFCHTMQRDGVVINIRPGIASRLKALCISNRKFHFLAKPALFSGLPWIADQLYESIWFIFRKTGFIGKICMQPVKLEFPEEKDFEFMRIQGKEDFHIPQTDELKMPCWLVKPKPENIFLKEKYYFNSFADRFSTFWLRWENDGKIFALIMVSLKDGVLKTLYLYCEDDFRNTFPREFMAYCFATQQIRTLITAQPIIVSYLSQKKSAVLPRRYFTRYSAVSKDLMQYSGNEPVLQDGDGDYRFT